MTIQLSYDELDGYVQQVCTGKKLIYISNKLEQPVPLLFKYPTTDDLLMAQIVYDRTLAEAKEQGMPTLAEMEKLIRSRGIYTDEDDDKIKKLTSRIEGQQSILTKTVRVPARRERIYENIRTLQEEVTLISNKKEPTLAMTQERKAAESKFLYMTRQGTFDPYTRELYWSTEKSFESEPDFLFRKRAFIEYIIFSHGLKSSIVRYLARSNLWRIRYVTALKTGDQLFGCSIRDYNTDQLTLLYWSHFYQSIYEMMSDDRPPDTIIEDDQALDAYMNDWQAERNRDVNAARAQKNNKYGNKSAWDHGETLVMRSNPVHSDIEYSDTLIEKSTSARASSVDAAPMGREAKKTGLTKARESVKPK